MFEQERTIGRLQRRADADPSLAACLLVGPFALGTNDDYSAIEAVLVYRDEESRARAWATRAEFAQSVMPYVAAKSVDLGPGRQRVLFSNGCQLDLEYVSLDTLQPSHRFSRVRILKDSSGRGEQLQSQAAGQLVPQPQMTAAELSTLDDLFWTGLWDVLRQLARGDADRPFPAYLELLQRTLPPLLRVLPADAPAHRGLLQAQYSQDTRLTRQHLGNLLAAYLAARQAVVDRFRLTFVAERAFESEMRRWVERLVGR